MMSSGLPEKVTLPEDAIDVLEGQPVLQEVLGPALSQMQTFHDRLSAEGLKRGLIGPRDTTIIWERHILNSAAIVPFVKAACEQSGSHRIADVGSGGGFPGIIEAACLPDYQITLIEPMERRVEWLQEVVDELGLNNVQILRSRSEDLIPKNSRSKKSVNQKHNKVKSQSRKESTDLDSNQKFTPFDVVTCRAVAPLTKLSAWTLPLLKSGGQLVALKGKSAQAEIEKAEKEIRKNGGRNPRVLEAPVAEGLESTHVVVIDKV